MGKENIFSKIKHCSIVKKWYYFGLLVIISLCFSCKDNSRNTIIKLVNEWNEKEIIFPSDTLFAVYKGSEVQKCHMLYKQYAIITYVDSLGCMNCKLQLSKWSKFIHELDSITDGSVPCLFFFHPKKNDKKKIIELLRRNNFTYPVCIDENDSLNILNKFPTDMMFQTFMLNRNAKVLAIGNPIHNLKVKNIYLKIVAGENLKLESDEKTKTKIVLEQRSADMGVFDWKQEQSVEFVGVNTGDELLVIEDVSASCGCTTVEYSKEPIQPNKSLVLKVKYKAEHPEHFNKTITVYCNAKNSPFQLKISGNAK